MKRYKKLLFAVLGMVLCFFLFLLWYQYRYAMDVVEPYTVNSSSLEKKLLIATQGSEFKNKVTQGIIQHFETDSIFIKVIDITSLEKIEPDVFDAIVLLHTWENWKPPVEVKLFVERTKASKDKIIVMTTSGEGSYKMEEVDAIVGESNLVEAVAVTDRIITGITLILKPHG